MTTKPFSLRSMTMDDYPAVLALWQATEGMGLSADDRPEGIARFLARNPSLSRVALDEEGGIAGAVLCGHDGRRGLLHHLAVRRDCRNTGLGRALVQQCLDGLREAGIRRCHLLVMRTNPGGLSFWKRVGWNERQDVALMSADTQP